MQIRTGMRSSWLGMVVVFLLALALMPLGCGGAGTVTVPGTGGGTNGGGGGDSEFAAFKVVIDWGARSRVIGLSSALSARISVPNADESKADIVWVENRPESVPGEPIRATYLAPKKAKVAPHVLTVDFFSEPNGGGTKVGFAQASASVVADDSLVVTISTYTGIQTVRVIPGQSLTVGEQRDLAFEAKDKNGNVVALAQAAAFFSVVRSSILSNGKASIETADNGAAVLAKRPAGGTVKVKVDGVESAPETVVVTSPAVLEVTPETTTIGSEFPLAITTNVVDAAENDVTFSIVNDNGPALSGSLADVTGTSVTYLAPKVTGDTVRTVEIEVVSNYDPAKVKRVVISVNAPAVVVTTPPSAKLTFQDELNIVAVVENLSPLFPDNDARRRVTWKVVKGPDGKVLGTVSPTGKYTAPGPGSTAESAVANQGRTYVEVTSTYDPTKKTLVPIDIVSEITVVPSPTSAKLAFQDELTFTAEVRNLSSTIPANDARRRVIWRVVAGPDGKVLGTVDTSGKYTAPAPGNSAASSRANQGRTYVEASSAYDLSKKVLIPVDIVSDVAVDVAIESTKVSVKGTRQFAATVTGLPRNAPLNRRGISWSVTGPNGEIDAKFGSISASGLYTAPDTVPRDARGNELTARVVASSAYDLAAQDSATVIIVGGSIDGQVK